MGLRARDFPTERVLSRTPLIIRTVRVFVWFGLVREAGNFLKSEKNSALEKNFYTVAEGENFRERKLRSGETFLKSEKNSVLENNFYTVAEGEKFRERELRSAEKF